MDSILPQSRLFYAENKCSVSMGSAQSLRCTSSAQQPSIGLVTASACAGTACCQICAHKYVPGSRVFRSIIARPIPAVKFHKISQGDPDLEFNASALSLSGSICVTRWCQGGPSSCLWRFLSDGEDGDNRTDWIRWACVACFGKILSGDNRSVNLSCGEYIKSRKAGSRVDETHTRNPKERGFIALDPKTALCHLSSRQASHVEIWFSSREAKAPGLDHRNHLLWQTPENCLSECMNAS